MEHIERVSVRNIAIAAVSLLSLVILFTSVAHAATTTGSVNITGVVKNGTAQPSDFTLQIKSGNSTISGSGDTIIFSGLNPGTYTITKSAGPSGYNIVWSGDCNSQGTVTIVSNSTKMCTASYIFGSVGSLKVNVVIKGGTASASNLTVHLKISGEADTGSPSGSGSTITFNQLTPGAYTVIESTPPSGYGVTWSGACNAQGNVTVVGNATTTCTVTNTFVSTRGGGSSNSGRTTPPAPPWPIL